MSEDHTRYRTENIALSDESTVVAEFVPEGAREADVQVLSSRHQEDALPGRLHNFLHPAFGQDSLEALYDEGQFKGGDGTHGISCVQWKFSHPYTTFLLSRGAAPVVH